MKKPEGLTLHSDWINEEEEHALVCWIIQQEWLGDTGLRRRVQQYGWTYSYRRGGPAPRDLAAYRPRPLVWRHASLVQRNGRKYNIRGTQALCILRFRTVGHTMVVLLPKGESPNRVSNETPPSTLTEMDAYSMGAS